jgi:hypothetical protein
MRGGDTAGNLTGMTSRRGARLLLALLVGALLGACALVPEGDSLTGAVEPDGGVVIGRGQFADGTEWSVTTKRSGTDLCSETMIAGLSRGSSCTTLGGNGVGGWGSSSGTGEPTVMEGFFDAPVAAIRIEAADGAHDVPLVPVAALGLSGRGFGFVLPAEVEPVALVTLDASGGVLERYELGRP